MKRDLRTIHFFSFLAIAAAIAVVLPAALLNRPDPPVASSLAELRGQDAAPGLPLALPGSAVSSLPARVEIWRNGSQFLLRLSPSRSAAQATVLAYWSPQAGSGEPGLPPSAWLLGEWLPPDGSRLEFPAQASTEPGALWLWSLAHREVLGRLELPPLLSLERAVGQ